MIMCYLFSDENPEAYAAKVREYFSARTKDKASLLRVSFGVTLAIIMKNSAY